MANSKCSSLNSSSLPGTPDPASHVFIKVWNWKSPRAKHRLVKTLVPGPSLPLNVSPAAGPVPAQLREEDSEPASETKFQSRRKLEASAQKKAEIYLIEFPSVSTSVQKPLSKATNELCASWGPQGERLTSLLPTHCQSSVPRAG